jgi:predicted dehydrogenase
VISTPGDSHFALIQAAIERNLHVFVEKPLTMTAEDGYKTVSMLEGKSLVNQVGYVNRFNEVFVEVKALLDSDIIGEIRHFRCEMYGATVLKDSKSSWRSKKTSGGGCMYEFASHCIDLAVYLFDQPDRVVGSIMESIYSSEVEDLVSSTFVYQNDCTGNIMVNWSDETYRKPTNIITILGTGGKIIADKHAYKIYLKEAQPERGFDKGWNTRYITDFAKSVRFYLRGNEFSQQLDYFIDCVEQGKTENVSSFSEALKTDVLMEEITKDASMSIANMGERANVSRLLKDGGKPTSLWKRFVK